MISPQFPNQAIDPAHRETCREILMKLELAQGFELFFIECNSPALQETLENYLEEQASDFTWLKVRFDAEIGNLREELLDRDLPIDASSVLSIRGLQHSIHSQKSAADVVARLNVARDLLPKQFPCLMILWLPVYALQNFSRFAPDLWSWRDGVFYFEEQALAEGKRFAPRGELLSLSGDDESDNYSKAFREGEIKFLTPIIEAFEPTGASLLSLKKHIRNLQKLAVHHYHLSHFEDALQLLKEVEKLAREVGDKATEGISLNNISQIYDVRGEYDLALKYLEESLTIRQVLGDRAGESVTLNNIAGIFRARGEYDLALKSLKQSLAISRSIGDKKREGSALNTIAVIFKAQGKYEQALKLLYDSLAIRREIDDNEGEAATLSNISMIFNAQGEYERALEFLYRALDIQQESGNRVGEGGILNNISTIYHKKGEYEQALKYLQASLSIRVNIGDKAGEASTRNNISQVYYARGEHKRALEYLQTSSKILQELGNVAGLCFTHFNIALIYWQNGEPQQARSIWLSVYEEARKINLAQVLNALEELTVKIGIEDGLNGWERLLQESGRTGENQESEALQINVDSSPENN